MYKHKRVHLTVVISNDPVFATEAVATFLCFVADPSTQREFLNMDPNKVGLDEVVLIIGLIVVIRLVHCSVVCSVVFNGFWVMPDYQNSEYRFIVIRYNHIRKEGIDD